MRKIKATKTDKKRWAYCVKVRKLTAIFLLLAGLINAATYYAQNSSVNIDSANQWNTATDGSGSALTWASLAADDILNANGKTAILLNVDFTCERIESDATLGGGFTVGAAGITRTISCDVQGGAASGLTGLNYTYALVINGSVAAGATASKYGAEFTTGVPTITINGDVTGGSNSSCIGLFSNRAAPITINGNVSAGTHVTAYGLNYTGSSTCTVVGNLIHTAYTSAVSGKLIYNPAATNYVQYPAPGSTTKNYYYDIPDVENVKNTDTVAGVTGTLNMSLYTLISGLVGPEWVVFGHDLYSGVPGEFRASDFANCTAENIKKNVTIDDVTGSYEGTGGGGGARPASTSGGLQ